MLFKNYYFRLCRLDNLILEAITNLKEPTGSNKTAIAMYIEVCFYPWKCSSDDIFLSICIMEILLSCLHPHFFLKTEIIPTP